MQRKPSHSTTKSKVFTVNKDKWNTKDDIGKPMKNALYVLSMPKGIFWAKAMSNVKKKSINCY